MSDESSDSDQSNGWTLLNNSDEEGGQISSSAETAVVCDDEIERSVEEQANASPDLQLESNLSDLKPDDAPSADAPLAEKSLSRKTESVRSDVSGSDIERISDDDVGNEPMNEEGKQSIYSIASDISLVNYYCEADIESLSSTTSVLEEKDEETTDLSSLSSSKYELPADLDIKCNRSYTHKPNTKVNVALNILLALTVTMVFGLGIGHFLGWSSRFTQQQNHVVKLKALQEELVDCLQNPDSSYVVENGDIMACYEKVDYWQKKFDNILSENHVLQDFILKHRNREDYDDDDDDKCEETNKNIVSEYRNLKFHLITQQLENVATLRRMEALKQQETAALQKVKTLQEENEVLKAQVIEDDDADQQRIDQLKYENHELRNELLELTNTMRMDDEAEIERSTELGSLRQQINQLKMENSELQQVIAKLRYGEPFNEGYTETATEPDVELGGHTEPNEELDGAKDEDVTTESEEMTTQAEFLVADDTNDDTEIQTESETSEPEVQLSTSESQVPENAQDDSILKSWLLDSMEELDIKGFMNHLLELATDKEAANQELLRVQETLQKGYEKLSEHAKVGLDTGTTIISGIHKDIVNRLREIVDIEKTGLTLPTEAIHKIGNALQHTFEKLHKVVSDVVVSAGGENADMTKVQKQVDKLISSLEKQWKAIRSKMWGEKEKINKKLAKKRLMEYDLEMPSKNDKSLGRKEDKRKRGASESNAKKSNANGEKAGKWDETVAKQRHKDKRSKNKKADKRQHHEAEKSRKVRDEHDSDDDKSKKHNKIDKNLYNNTGNQEEHGGEWYFGRGNTRTEKRQESRKSDWVFDRARDRDNERKNSEKSEWYFNRGKDRQGKKRAQEDKRDNSDDESEDDEDEHDRKSMHHSKKRSQEKWRREQKSHYHHHTQFEWSVSDQGRNYFASS